MSYLGIAFADTCAEVRISMIDGHFLCFCTTEAKIVKSTVQQVADSVLFS